MFLCTNLYLLGIPNVTINGDAVRNETALQDIDLIVNFDFGQSFAPSLQIQWYFNGQPINATGRYSVFTVIIFSTTLTISNAVPSDSGVYRVDIATSVGSDSATFTVNIEGYFSNVLHA